MTDKERLNSILRLRLFFSTEKELSNLIGYQLRGNHFSRFKEFQCEAYFSMFEKASQAYMHGATALGTLLDQYEATSKFYKRHIEKTAYERSKTFIPVLLDSIYLDEAAAAKAVRTKDVQLCELYAERNNDGRLNIGILILLTYGLIPTFKHKATQDVKDIIGDFQRAYDILAQLAGPTAHNEMLFLQELRLLIEEERAGDKYLNRLLLIHAVNDAIGRIYALQRPDMLCHYSREFEPMDFTLARFWRCETEADNVVWEFEGTEINHYYLYRKEIDREDRQIRCTRYQLNFRDVGYRHFCYTIIMRPSYIYDTVLHHGLSQESLTFDYTDIEYDADKQTVKELSFTINSPLGAKPLTLKPVKDDTGYYTTFIDHTGIGEGFADIDTHPEYAVDMYTLDVAVGRRFLLFNLGGELYRMDKFDEDGNETVAGISALTHNDNYVYAKLNDNGTLRSYICLDQVNQHLELGALAGKSYFKKVEDVCELL